MDTESRLLIIIAKKKKLKYNSYCNYKKFTKKY